MSGKPKDRTGQRYGKLVATHISHTRIDNRCHPQVYWFCQCDCGAVKAIMAKSLQSGNTKSCGCTWKTDPGPRTHGMSSSYTYTTWRGMKDRCGNPKHRAWHIYGGKGIKICQRWDESFEAFLADMGERPQGKTLDRIDPAGDYCPENCRWATPREQARNLPHTIHVAHGDGTVSLTEYAQIRGIVPGTLYVRVVRKGQDPIEAADELVALKALRTRPLGRPPRHRNSGSEASA